MHAGNDGGWGESIHRVGGWERQVGAGQDSNEVGEREPHNADLRTWCA